MTTFLIKIMINTFKKEMNSYIFISSLTIFINILPYICVKSISFDMKKMNNENFLLFHNFKIAILTS